MNSSGTARILSRLWLLVIVVVAITVLYLAKVLFLPLAFALLFAFLLAPVVTLLERLRLPRALAAILVIFGFAALLGTSAWMLFTQLVAVANDLPVYRDNITQKMEAIHSPSDSAFSRAQKEVEKFSEELGLANSTATAEIRPGATTREQASGFVSGAAHTGARSGPAYRPPRSVGRRRRTADHGRPQRGVHLLRAACSARTCATA